MASHLHAGADALSHEGNATLIKTNEDFLYQKWTAFSDGQLITPIWKDAYDDPVYTPTLGRDPCWINGGFLATPPLANAVTPYGTCQPWNHFGYTDNFEVEVQFFYDGSLNIGQQNGGLVHILEGDISNVHERGAYFVNDITIGASVGGTGFYLHTNELDPFTDPEGLMDMNIGSRIIAGHDATRNLIRSVNGKLSGYVHTVHGWERLAGPIDMSAFCPSIIGRDGAGCWVCEGIADPLARNGSTIKIRPVPPEVTDLGVGPAVPVLRVGTVVKNRAVTAVALPQYTMIVGEEIYACVVTSTLASIPAAPTGWTRVTTPTGSARMGIYRKDTKATGLERTSDTILFSSASGSPDMAGVIFSLRGANPWQTKMLGLTTQFKTTTTDTSLPNTGHQVFGQNELGIWIGYCMANETITPPTGYTSAVSAGTSGPLMNFSICSKTWSLTTRGRIATGNIDGARQTNGAGGTISAIAFRDPPRMNAAPTPFSPTPEESGAARAFVHDTLVAWEAGLEPAEEACVAELNDYTTPYPHAYEDGKCLNCGRIQAS